MGRIVKDIWEVAEFLWSVAVTAFVALIIVVLLQMIYYLVFTDYALFQ